MPAAGGRDELKADERRDGAESDESTGEVVVRLDAEHYLEALFLSAVAVVLAIRAFLHLTGFPQIGGGGLHIGHMLWGGFLMLAGLVISISFVGARARWLAAVVGGAGFGAFIDELGKFVTEDNNYFFQPAIALIYLVFVGLFFSFEAIAERLPLSPRSRLANASETPQFSVDFRCKRILIRLANASENPQDQVLAMRFDDYPVSRFVQRSGDQHVP
jgi:hypothetical protein